MSGFDIYHFSGSDMAFDIYHLSGSDTVGQGLTFIICQGLTLSGFDIYHLSGSDTVRG